jgi:Cd2+/Zn2+-exporting ATPase
MSDQAKLQIELPVILPDIPDARDQCVKTLVTMLTGQDGVTEAHIVNGNAATQPQLCIHYDRNQLSLARVRELTLAAGAEITRRIGHISERLPNPLHARAARTLAARLSNTPGILEADVSPSGSLRLEFDRHMVNFAALTAQLQQDGIDISIAALQGHGDPLISQPEVEHGCPTHTVGHGEEHVRDEHPHVHEAKEHSHAHGGLFGERTELVFSLTTGALLATGWLIEQFEVAPAWGPIAFYLLAYVFGGWFTLREAIENLQAKRFEIDSLMLVAAIGAAALGKWAEGALLLFLFSLGHALEHWAMGRARRAIEALAELAPETALVKRGDQTEEVPVDRLAQGDVIVVRPNERLAADGIVIAGTSSVNQAPITGESVPVDKRAAGDPNADLDRFEHVRPEHRVFAGTINGAGVLEVIVARAAAQSTLARVMQMVTDAETQRSPAQHFTERFEKVFVPCVFVLAGLLLLAWVVIDEPFSASFYRAMAVLVAASPCALAISVPSAVLSGVARAARSGVLIKGGAALENLGTLTAIAFDKTGTLTEGKPRLTDVITAEESTEPELLGVALAVEQHSDHPLAAAIVDGARQRLGAENPVSPANAIESITGRGIKALLDGVEVYIGKPILFDEIAGPPAPRNVAEANAQLVASGRTTMIVRWGERYLGVLGVMDTPRPQASNVMHRLRAVGITRLIMISGDNQRVAEAVAKSVGLTEARGDLLPEHKVDTIQALRKDAGKVAMVGDGVNDAPAMANATVGIAMGAAGSDVALETADVALMADDLTKLPFAVALSRRASSIIKQNLWVSLGVVAMLVPATIFGLNIGTAVLFHEGSTLLVVVNALRLLAFTDTGGAAES